MFRDLIKQLGGPTKIAAELRSRGMKINASAIQAWSDRDRIPHAWRPDVAKLAREYGIQELPDEIRKFSVLT